MVNIQKSQRKGKILFVILAIVLVLATWYGLKIKGITMTEDPVYEKVLICENTEETHVHSEECYENVIVSSENKQEESEKQQETNTEIDSQKEADQTEIIEDNVINNINVTNEENIVAANTPSTYALDETSDDNNAVNVYVNIDGTWTSIGTIESFKNKSSYRVKVSDVTSLITNVLGLDLTRNDFTVYYSVNGADSFSKASTGNNSTEYKLGSTNSYKDIYITSITSDRTYTKKQLSDNNTLKVYSITELDSDGQQVGNKQYVYTKTGSAQYTLPTTTDYYVNDSTEVTNGGTTITITGKTTIKQIKLETSTVTVKYINGTIEYVEVVKGKKYTLGSNLKWKVGDQTELTDGGTEITVNNDIIVEESNQITIIYTVDTSTNATGLSADYKYDGIAVPTVQGSNTYTTIITYNDGTTVENLSDKYVTPYNSSATLSKDRKVLEFTGWKESKNSTIITAGATLSWNELYNYAQNGEINLNTAWNTYKNYQYVNFYVNYKSQALDTDGSVSGQPTDNFTPSLWASYVGNAETEQNQTPIAGSADNSYIANKQIRELEGDKGNGSRYIYSIPSDEYIFSQLKNYASKLSIQGESIDVDQLDTDYFEVRWYVFKLQSDCWHIDGRLVRKEGKMVINKTFTGSKNAIEAVTGYSFETNTSSDSNYYIEMQGGETTTNLYLKDAKTLVNGTTTDEKGVTTYILTYTWEVTVSYGINYTISEKNYSVTNYSTDTVYNINDPEMTRYKKVFNPDGTYYYEKDEETGEFITIYTNQSKGSTTSDTATIKGINNYASDIIGAGEKIDYNKLIKINFTNTYAPTSAITIKKEDSITNNGLANAQFSIYEVNNGNIDTNSPLKFNYNESIYNYTTDESGITVLTSPTGGAIIIDGLPTGKTYKLVEISVPEGYDGKSSVEVELTTKEDGSGNSIVVPVITKGTGNGYDENKKVLEIDNASKLTSVKLTKRWQEDVPEEYIKDVIVELYLNNMPISNYTLDYDLNGDGKVDSNDVVAKQVTLNQSNGWTYTWNNLPLYIDGSKAIYSVREVKIGTLDAVTAGEYDSTTGTWSSSDAYSQYRAQTTPQVEKIENNEVTEVSFELINSIHLIRININKISPLGNALQGATFQIQKIDDNGNIDSEFTTVTKTTSEDGNLSFVDLEYDTKYMITETVAPERYYLDKTPIYVIINKGENEKDTLTIYKDNTFSEVAEEGDYEYVSLNETSDTLNIVNVSHIQMPKAGGCGVYIFYILGIALMASSSIIIYLRKNKIKKGM